MLHLLQLIDFRLLNDNDLTEILTLRNSEYIRLKMDHTERIALGDHLRFCHSLIDRTDALYLKVCFDGLFEGVVDFQHIKHADCSYESGCYFREGSNAAYFANLAAFEIAMQQGLKEAKCHVKKSNAQAILFNTMKLGYALCDESDDNMSFSKRLDVSGEAKRLREKLQAHCKTDYRLWKSRQAE